MTKFLGRIVLLLVCSSTVFADDGLINLKSPYDIKYTADRLEQNLREKGMKIFSRIDHAQGALEIGKHLRPTELIIFGNPKVGTPLMQCAQRVGLDLPQKALVWEDERGQVWLSYNDPQYLVRRHHIEGCDEVIDKIEKALGNIARDSTVPHH